MVEVVHAIFAVDDEVAISAVRLSRGKSFTTIAMVRDMCALADCLTFVQPSDFVLTVVQSLSILCS